MADQPNDVSVASSALRLRPDLHWSLSPGPLADRWRAKDPLALVYHEFGADEYFLLQQFDGSSSLAQIKQRYDARFHPNRIRPERLLQFAGEAHARGLLLADGARQGAVLLDRGRRTRRRVGWSQLLSLLCVRLPGFDPNRLLDALAPLTRWFWRPATFVILVLAASLAIGLLIGRAGEVASRLPSSQQFLQAGNLALLAAAFVFVKLIHELAHSLACRHVGARCHEMGVMLIALAPCFYCDVTDLWMIPSRAKRMLVSAAGMYAELAIAVVCAYLWMFSIDGVVSAILLNLILACSVSTLLFNANPLLKLDGYFLLSDLVGVSNLHQRAQRSLMGPLAAWLRGLQPKPGDFDWRLAGYAAASFVYRMFVVAVLLTAAYGVLASYGLRPLGDLLVASTVLGLLFTAGMQVWPALRSPLARRTIRWGRVGTVSVLVGVCFLGVLQWPVPRDIRTPAVFEMQDAQPVAAVVGGRLVDCLAEGERVAAGEPIARLENPALARRRVRLLSELERAELGLQTLRRRASVNSALLTEVPTARAAVARAEADLAQLDEEIAQLVIRAGQAGVLVGAPRQAPLAAPGSPLPPWEGRLVDACNRGAWVAPGDIVALVAPQPDEMRATLMIDPAKIRGVEPGLPVRLLADQAAETVFRGEIEEISRAEFAQLPAALQRHPDVLLTDRDASPADSGDAGPRTLRPVVLATLKIPTAGPNSSLRARHSSHGLCKIEAPSEAVGALLWRWLTRTFPLTLSSDSPL